MQWRQCMDSQRHRPVSLRQTRRAAHQSRRRRFDRQSVVSRRPFRLCASLPLCRFQMGRGRLHQEPRDRARTRRRSGSTPSAPAPSKAIASTASSRPRPMRKASASMRCTSTTPTRRLDEDADQPQDIANMMLFICSDAGHLVSGQILGVDGNVEYLALGAGRPGLDLGGSEPTGPGAPRVRMSPRLDDGQRLVTEKRCRRRWRIRVGRGRVMRPISGQGRARRRHRRGYDRGELGDTQFLSKGLDVASL